MRHVATGVGAVLVAAFIAAWAIGHPSKVDSRARRAAIGGQRVDAIGDPIPKMKAADHAAAVPDALVLRYDSERDRLTIRARSAPLTTLLEQLAAVTGVDIVGVGPLQLDESISIELEGASLQETIDVLLRGFDKVVVYSSRLRQGGNAEIERVIFARRSESGREQGEPAQVAESGREGVHAGTSSALAVLEDPVATLLEAIGSGNSDLAVRIVDELLESGAETEKDRATESLVAFVDEANPGNLPLAFDSLERLSPELAVEKLAEQATVPSEPGDGSVAGDAPVDIKPQLVAIAALGNIGGPDVVNPLIEAFQIPEPYVRQVAAENLAAIGQPAADAFLIDASQDPHVDWAEPAAMGIALRGSPEAKAALAAEIEQETVQTEDFERVNELLGGV